MLNEFPYSLINEMRGFINHAPFFFRGFSDLTAAVTSPFASDRGHELLGTPTRMRRYLLLAILGAELDIMTAATHKMAVLADLFKQLDVKLSAADRRSPYDSELRTDLPRLTDLGSQNVSLDYRLLTSKLTAALTEYLDFLFLGERPLGLTVVVCRGEDRDSSVVVRRFGRLAYGSYITDLHEIHVLDYYPSRIDSLEIEGFRGKLAEAIPYTKKLASAVLLDGRPLGESGEVSAVIEKLSTAMARRACYYETRTASELEVEQQAIYASELNGLMNFYSFHPSWRGEMEVAIKDDLVAGVLRKEMHFDQYSDVYFHLLNRSIDHMLESVRA
jgi:hypothetical protein